MLCTAKSDTFCTKLTCFLSIRRCISVCTNLQCSVFVSPSHDSSELAGDCSFNCRDCSIINATCRTIKGDYITFMILFSCKCKFLIFFIHNDIAASGYTASTHTTGNYCCMGCHTTTNSQDTLRSFHTCDIFR